MDIFSPLRASDVDELSSNIREIHFDVDSVICKQGDAADSMYIVKQGVVAVTIAGMNNTTIQVAKIGAGGFFGEISLFTGKPRTAQVTAIRPLIVYEITKEDIQSILTRRPELSRKFSKIILGRQSQLNSLFMNPEQKEKDITDLVNQIANFFNLKKEESDSDDENEKAA